jgi:hypothetical protein
MVTFRPLVHAVLVPALLAGCSQSLFDANPGGGNGNRDGGPTPNEPDAGADELDGGMTPVVPDAGSGGVPDATVRDECPVPCAADAFRDFRNVQGEPDHLWGYIEVQPEQPDSPYVDMSYAILPGPLVGWQGTSTGAQEPTIALCNTPNPDSACAELAKVLALTSPGNAANAHHPGLVWIARDDGRYAISGAWQVSSLAPEASTIMKLTRNSHSEVLHEVTPILTTAPYEFNFEIDVVVGDRIVLTATATTEASVSVGVNLFVTGPLGLR